jgi:hypothetical protein
MMPLADSFISLYGSIPMAQIGYICSVRGTTGMIFIVALMYCSITAIAKQPIYPGRIGALNSSAISASFISAATTVNRSRQIDNARELTDCTRLAERLSIPVTPYTVNATRAYGGQAFTQVVSLLNHPSVSGKCPILAAFTPPLHHYHIVFPHHHFW